mgnify:CR=1 FL=1
MISNPAGRLADQQGFATRIRIDIFIKIPPRYSEQLKMSDL